MFVNIMMDLTSFYSLDVSFFNYLHVYTSASFNFLNVEISVVSFLQFCTVLYSFLQFYSIKKNKTNHLYYEKEVLMKDLL